jgi:mannose-6-phosphate isomerase-like protein (cupin superfamily)
VDSRPFASLVAICLVVVAAAAALSGAAGAQQDTESARVAAAAPETPSASDAQEAQVTHLPGPDVARAFEKGAPLLETAAYKIHASRRSEPGEAEVHLRDTDVIHVLEGKATLVTGGRIVAGREVAAGEIRGTSIEAGTERRIGPGDVVVVPSGTPHWFEAVEGPVVYYVVKVTETLR